MKQIEDIFGYLNEWADVQMAEDWDNVGILVDAGIPVKRVLVTLDITKEVIEEAAEKNCQLIVSHHPVIFRGLKKICKDDPAFVLAQKGISAICMHTNLDAAVGGVNDVLAERLGLEQVRPFAGLGRIGVISPITVEEFAKRCKNSLHTPVMVADAGKKISTVAVVGGSGGEFFREAAMEGADCLLTGEASHHHGLDALDMGISLLLAGHFATEHPIVQEIAKRLEEKFPTLELLCSETNKAPFMLAE